MRTARSRTSGENLFDLFMAQSSQRMERPQIPGRFKTPAKSWLDTVYGNGQISLPKFGHRITAGEQLHAKKATVLIAWTALTRLHRGAQNLSDDTARQP